MYEQTENQKDPEGGGKAADRPGRDPSSITLGVKGKTVRKGQAKKSTGWMPWH